MQSTSHPQPTPFRAVIDGGLIRVCDVMGHDFGGLSFRFEGARTQAIKDRGGAAEPSRAIAVIFASKWDGGSTQNTGWRKLQLVTLGQISHAEEYYDGSYLITCVF